MTCGIDPIDGEEWRDIYGFGGRYKVSNMGRVGKFPPEFEADGRRNRCKPRLLSVYARNGAGAGWRYVQISEGGRVYLMGVANLVISAFRRGSGRLADSMRIVYRNGDSGDCRLSNLRRCAKNPKTMKKFYSDYKKPTKYYGEAVEMYLNGYSAAGISFELGIDENTVGTAIRRARKRNPLIPPMEPDTGRMMQNHKTFRSFQGTVETDTF